MITFGPLKATARLMWLPVKMSLTHPWLISGRVATEERNSELEDMSIETSKSEQQGEKRLKNTDCDIQESWTSKKGVTYR